MSTAPAAWSSARRTAGRRIQALALPVTRATTRSQVGHRVILIKHALADKQEKLPQWAAQSAAGRTRAGGRLT